jgi:hypothetical protein
MWIASSVVLVAGLVAGGPSNVSDVVKNYCAGCHNGSMRSPSGGLLDQFDAARIAEDAEIWGRAYRQLQAGTMPPAGAPRPDRVTVDAMLKSIEEVWIERLKPAPRATGPGIAERLAALLWNSVPDASLLKDARSNRLNEPTVLERQIRRMLADDKAQAFVSRFFVPWLGLQKLSTSQPDKKFFPDYDPSLRDAFAKETELFLLSQLRDDRDPVEIWSANYTFLNDQLARHYDIPNVKGSQFRRVRLPSPERAGLLGQGSILMITSRLDSRPESVYTSPAARSTWVRMHFLGAPNPMPAPNASPVKPELPITPQTRTLPAEPCMNCHRNFFPLGYALENFDPVGRWRTRDQIGPVDASGAFVDGAPMNGVNELRKVLLQRPEAFRTTITENLLIYTAGKPVGSTRPSADTLAGARRILRGMPNARWSAIIAAIVKSNPL